MDPTMVPCVRTNAQDAPPDPVDTRLVTALTDIHITFDGRIRRPDGRMTCRGSYKGLDGEIYGAKVPAPPLRNELLSGWDVCPADTGYYRPVRGPERTRCPNKASHSHCRVQLSCQHGSRHAGHRSV
eukprot:2792972-Rhodomonas_salina.1